jgi:hypothetical protein
MGHSGTKNALGQVIGINYGVINKPKTAIKSEPDKVER